MLYTASIFDLRKTKQEMKVYYILKSHGNDEVAPEPTEINYYKSGILTWEGLKLNYLAKIYKSEASEWMKKVSEEAVLEDVVLVDEEKDANHSYRKLLAELMKNMYSSNFNFNYMGELIN